MSLKVMRLRRWRATACSSGWRRKGETRKEGQKGGRERDKCVVLLFPASGNPSSHFERTLNQGEVVWYYVFPLGNIIIPNSPWFLSPKFIRYFLAPNAHALPCVGTTCASGIFSILIIRSLHHDQFPKAPDPTRQKTPTARHGDI